MSFFDRFDRTRAVVEINGDKVVDPWELYQRVQSVAWLLELGRDDYARERGGRLGDEEHELCCLWVAQNALDRPWPISGGAGGRYDRH